MHDGQAPVALSLEVGRLFEAFPEASFVLGDGRIEWVNERLVQLLGHDPTGSDVKATIPDWREGLDAEVPFEASLRCPGGGSLPVELRARAPSGDGRVDRRRPRCP